MSDTTFCKTEKKTRTIYGWSHPWISKESKRLYNTKQETQLLYWGCHRSWISTTSTIALMRVTVSLFSRTTNWGNHGWGKEEGAGEWVQWPPYSVTLILKIGENKIWNFTFLNKRFPSRNRLSILELVFHLYIYGASLVVQTVKNPPAMQETWVWSLCWEDPLEKGMITHSSILAWRITWKEEPGGLQSMGSQNSQTRLSN